MGRRQSPHLKQGLKRPSRQEKIEFGPPSFFRHVRHLYNNLIPSFTMDAYKWITVQHNTRALAHLRIPPEARTNCGRTSVRVPETAAYLADRAVVLRIELEDGTEFDGVGRSPHYESAHDYTFFSKGETATSQFLDDPEKEYGFGIRFFRSRERAVLDGVGIVKDGLYKAWFANGQLNLEIVYRNSRPHGPFRSWYANGSLYLDCIYEDGHPQGLYQEYHENGRLAKMQTYNAHGIPEGTTTRYDTEGRKTEETLYNADGVGIFYQKWDTAGVLREEIMTREHPCSLCRYSFRRWNANGEPMETPPDESEDESDIEDDEFYRDAYYRR